MTWMIWLAIIVIGICVAIGLVAMCRIGAQSDALTARIRRAQADARRGK